MLTPMRALYSLLWYAALPVAPLRLLWRGRREPGYREHVGERYGRYRGTVPPRILWVHAVSLGETRAAAPLVERLRRAYPDATLLLTHMTATGRATGRALFGDGVLQAWLPYDAPFAVRRFLAHFKPCAGLIMETELWPNLVALSREAGVPIYLVNARMSERSARLYAAFPALTRPMLAALSGVAAQTDADAARLAALGAPGAVVTGNVKFDVTATSAGEALGREFRARFGETRPVWVAASTRDGEEAMILDALVARELPHGALTVIVPRHPQRFAAVADLLRRRGKPFVLRSSNAPVTADVEVVLGDSMGEMAGYYAAADIAFVGGSLLPLGGQNLIEPIGAGRPTLVGPHMFNFADAAEKALAAGAAIEVADAPALIATVAALIGDAPRREAMRTAALAFHAAHHGAADRLAAWLAPRLDAAFAATRNPRGLPPGRPEG
ncbi:MAG: lipid IV(A) 3-deoxy-D-manno-octulosonic acid transferase, partial [Casimicrobiaceae bacterium]